MNKNLERFIKYVKIDTQSNDESLTNPSTMKQLDLANVLFNELKEMNVKCSMSKEGIIIGEIPSNINKEVPTTAAQAIAVADAEVVDEETVAVITAALMAYYKQAKPECGFIVKRIKRI